MKAAALGFRTGFTAGVQSFKRYYDNPSMPEGGALLANRADFYLTLWSFYDNSAYEDLARWSTYKNAYKLYRQLRSLYNPTRRLVDFYAGAVYPGVLSLDAENLPDGVQIAIPLADDTPDEVKAAIGQFWRWSNWQATKSVYVRYGAVTGNVLLEIIDDVDAGIVSGQVVWPGQVTWLDLDSTGNVRAYVIEYMAVDDDGFSYAYRKEVTADEYATFKDRIPHDFTGAGTRWVNPYGFVPAVWVKHKEIGGDFGAPAIHGSLGKIDEVNSLASHIHDHVHKAVDNPRVVFATGNISQITGPNKQRKRAAETDANSALADDITSNRETIQVFQGPPGGRIDSLVGNLQITEAMAAVQGLLDEIAADHPELALYKELRAMSQLTGPAADRVMGDVGALVGESSANYDRGSIALFGMALAIGGWRANRGDWGPLTKQQQVFTPFNLESYTRGDVSFDIQPRTLIPMTELERLELERRKVALQIDQRAASLDLTTVATDLQTAAESSVVRAVIPRGSNG